MKTILGFLVFVVAFLGSSEAFADDWFECRVTFTARASPTDKITRFEKWLPVRKAASLGQAHVNARAAFAPGSNYQGLTVERIVGDPYCLSVDPPGNIATKGRVFYCRVAMKYKVFRRVGNEQGKWVFDQKQFVGNPEGYTRIAIAPDTGSAKSAVFSSWQSKIKNEWSNSPALQGETIYVLVQFFDLVGSCWESTTTQPAAPSDWPSALTWQIAKPNFP